MVVGDGGAARGDEAAALEVSPRHALRRAVISEIETKVLHGRQGERRDCLGALAVGPDWSVRWLVSELTSIRYNIGTKGPGASEGCPQHVRP